MIMEYKKNNYFMWIIKEKLYLTVYTELRYSLMLLKSYDLIVTNCVLTTKLNWKRP